jgi:hypothetical protein
MHLKVEYTVIRRIERYLTERDQIVEVASSRSSGRWSSGRSST